MIMQRNSIKKILFTLFTVLCISNVTIVFAQTSPSIPTPRGTTLGSTGSGAGVSTPSSGGNLGATGSGAGVSTSPAGGTLGASGSGAGVPVLPAGGTLGATGSGTTSSPSSGSSGTPLQIAVPPSHGLPGSSGAEAMITTVVNNVINFVAIIAIVAFIFSAIQFLLAQGRADAIGKAKKNLFNIVLGFAFLMLAWSLVYIILQFLGFGR